MARRPPLVRLSRLVWLIAVDMGIFFALISGGWGLAALPIALSKSPIQRDAIGHFLLSTLLFSLSMVVIFL